MTAGNGKAPSWRDKLITAEELRNKTFPPTSFIVRDILPEGLAILSGKPKAGKSFMALDLCLGVTSGETVLGNIKPMTGSALYAANEDTDRRLKGRIAKYVSPFSSWPECLALTTSWSRLDAGGVDDLREWASNVPEPRLAVIDTLATVRPVRRNNETPYDADYRALAELHDFVGAVPGLAVLVLQHNRKADSDDPIDLISGTLGGPGVADTLLVISKSSQGTTLARARHAMSSQVSPGARTRTPRSRRCRRGAAPLPDDRHDIARRRARDDVRVRRRARRPDTVAGV